MIRATEVQKYFSEWRVYFDCRIPLREEVLTCAAIADWIRRSCEGEAETDFRISSYGNYASFLRYEDALLCYTAFA